MSLLLPRLYGETTMSCPFYLDRVSAVVSLKLCASTGACAEKIAGMGPNWKSSEISSVFPCISDILRGYRSEYVKHHVTHYIENPTL